MKFTYYGHASFLVETGNHKLLSLTMDMQLISTWANLKFAIMPVGDNFTMGVEDAAGAAAFVKTTTVLGVHYDTSGYIVIDKATAKKTFEAQGIALLLPGIGETVNPIPEEL